MFICYSQQKDGQVNSWPRAKMVNFKRKLDLRALCAEHSLFLFGPRGTGKSYLIRETLSDEALIINLLRSGDFNRLSTDPGLLEGMILASGKSLVVIDEVQKLPILLDEVHRLIEEKQLRFLLTGSSARKLKRGQANLLAGRARLATLGPLVYQEIPRFDLGRYLLWGGLPAIQSADDKELFLESYVETYLKEEVLAEQVARNLPNFSRFLKTAALMSGELLNFSGIASDAQLAVSTAKNYVGALEDTLIGSLLEPWTESKKRKAIVTAKFYLFDVGVRNYLIGIKSIPEKTELFGQAFEHFIFMELRAFVSLSRPIRKLFFWRSTGGHEVDFLVGDWLAIEVKSASNVGPREAKHLMALREEGTHRVFVVVSNDPLNRHDGGIWYFHWQEFLDRLWNKKPPFAID